MKGIFGKLSKKQLYALCGVLLIIICAGIFFATRKPECGVDEEAPFRKKPKAMGTPYIDPAVMMQVPMHGRASTTRPPQDRPLTS